MPMDEVFFNKRPEKDSSGEDVAIRIVIEGRVQKVGFRQWMKQAAVKHGVCGWVRNKADMTVEALLYGPKGQVSDVITQCYQGPPFAHVKRVKEYPQKDVENIPTEFVILPST